MNAVRPLEASDQPVKEGKKAPRFNFYPLLGVLLAIIAAVLAYGGIVLLLVEDWSFLPFIDADKTA